MSKTLFAVVRTSLAVRAGLLGLGYLAGAEIGHALTLRTAEQAFATFWPPAGMLLAALAVSPYRAWGWMLGAACAANLVSDVGLHGKALVVSLGFCTANGAEACLSAWLLRRYVGQPITLGRVEEVLALVFWSAVASPLLGAALGAGVVALAYGAPYWSMVPLWWVADALGVLVVAPVALTWATGWSSRIKAQRLVEAVLGFLGLVVAAGAVYGEWLAPPLRIPIFVLPFLLWAGLRFGPRGAATALLVVALVGVGCTVQGRGPYAALTSDPWAKLVRAQTTLFVVCLTVLSLAALAADRRRSEDQRVRLIGELEQALAEIRTLQGLIPLCAWCKKMRNDEGLWQSIEEYLQAHTDARVSHGMCADCMERQMAAIGAQQ